MFWWEFLGTTRHPLHNKKPFFTHHTSQNPSFRSPPFPFLPLTEPCSCLQRLGCACPFNTPVSRGWPSNPRAGLFCALSAMGDTFPLISRPSHDVIEIQEAILFIIIHYLYYYYYYFIFIILIFSVMYFIIVIYLYFLVFFSFFSSYSFLLLLFLLLLLLLLLLFLLLLLLLLLLFFFFLLLLLPWSLFI